MEGNRQTACEETTVSLVTNTDVGNVRDETHHVDSSPNLREDLADADKIREEVGNTAGKSTAQANPATASNTDTADQRRSSPSNEMEAPKLASPNGPADGEVGSAITEAGVTEPEESVSQEQTSQQLGEASPEVESTGKLVDENLEKKLTVPLRLEVAVVDDDIQRRTSDADEDAQVNAGDRVLTQEVGDTAADRPKGTSSPVAPTSPVDADKERPLEAEPTPPSDRRTGVTESPAFEPSDSATPGQPGTSETPRVSSRDGRDRGFQSGQTTPRPPTRPWSDRAPTQASDSTEFTYDEGKDFRTPDYDCAQTPLYSTAQEQRTVSRGDSTRSVTFADDPVGRRSARGHEVRKEETNEASLLGGADEGTADVKREAMVATEEDKTEENETEAGSKELFPTAVSEATIEEAKLRRIERATGDAGLRQMFGEPRLEARRSMENVVGSRAREHFDRGCVLLSELRHGPAVLCFDKALNLCPKEVRYYLMRAEAYLQMCDFQSAILNFKKACVLAPDNDAYYTRLAFVYYFQGQTLFDQCLFAEALESFSRASEMRPEVIGYHTRSVACLAALQRHGECLALVNKRLEVERGNPDLYIMRARLHELFRNTSLCYYDLKDAVALDPGRAEAGALMRRLEAKAEDSRAHAIRLQLQGKLKEARHKMSDAVETNPAVADYHLLRGALHRRLHDYNAAIDDFLLALDKTDHDEQNRVYLEAQRQLLLTYNDFAVECFLGAHFEEAIILLNKAIKGEKREKGLYTNRGDCFFRLNELHFALADYHQALELDDADWAVRSRIASIHAEFGRMDYEEHSYREAEARFTVAVQHNPRVGSYYLSRAKVRFMLENHGGARHDLLVTLHIEPNHEDILSLLPRLFPGKPIGDILRSKAARQAKAEVENAAVTASPVRLPSLNGDAARKEEQPSSPSQGAKAKQVAFASAAAAPPESVMPDLKACMDEISFNTVLAKKKKKISANVKSVLRDRQTLWAEAPKLCPQPPARPYAVRGGTLNKNQSNIDPAAGWRSFGVGVGLK